MKIEVGKSYRTRGGWKAVVGRQEKAGFKVNHGEERGGFWWHDPEGKWGAPDQNHPEYDLISEWDDWIEWNGGECPVAEGTRIQTRLRGDTSHRPSWTDSPENMNWKHTGCLGDILSYRVVQEEKDPVCAENARTENEPDLLGPFHDLGDVLDIFKRMHKAEQSRALAYLNSRFGE